LAGTKLHQRTLGNITKRKSTYEKAVTRYNKLCDELKDEYKEEYNIPPPLRLEGSLEDLKDDSNLAQDVWIGSPTEPIPQWMSDERVRKGIRGLHLLDRCREEKARVSLERRNLVNWYEKSMATLEVARRAADGMVHLVYNDIPCSNL
jgi:hypothetical protein